MFISTQRVSLVLGVLGFVILSQLETLSYGAGAARLKEIPFQTKTAHVSKELRVCFSPGGNCDEVLLEFIRGAKESLDVAIFDLNLDQFAHELLVASKKIKVRVVADKRQAYGPSSLIPLLIKGGIEVKFGKQKGIMHNKFTIVDQVKVETGSFNYTNPAVDRNQENQIYIGDPKIVAKYLEQFEEIWEGAVIAKISKKTDSTGMLQFEDDHQYGTDHYYYENESATGSWDTSLGFGGIMEETELEKSSK